MPKQTNCLTKGLKCKQLCLNSYLVQENITHEAKLANNQESLRAPKMYPNVHIGHVGKMSASTDIQRSTVQTLTTSICCIVETLHRLASFDSADKSSKSPLIMTISF